MSPFASTVELPRERHRPHAVQRPRARLPSPCRHRPRRRALRRAGATLLLLAASACAAHAAGPLPRLGVDLARAGVSGLSSGGYMAVQMHVVHSATFARGVGVVAGGPYDCAEGSFFNAGQRCMKHDAPVPVARLAALTEGRARSGDIDPVAGLASSKVYLYAGGADRKVSPTLLDELLDYYRRFVPPGHIVVRRDPSAGHAMATEGQGSACGASEPPFLADCGFDLAGAILSHLHGPLAPRNDGPPRGRLLAFDQTAFVRGHGMAATGYVYVPQACAAGAAGDAAAAGGRAVRCGLHVAFHGCRQNAASVGEAFVRHAGYNRWADANALVVLYPQTGGSAPNGCWDWWGYDSPRYATKAGPQVAAVKAMVDALAATPASASARVLAPASAPASAPFRPACHTASNVAHVAAGRARASMGMALARGSDQNLGWWNVFVTTTLKEVSPGHWVVGACP